MNDYRKWSKLAKKNGISSQLFHGRIKLGWDLEKAAATPKGITKPKPKPKPKPKKVKPKEKDIAIYEGDQFWMVGSPEEVAKKLNKSVKHVKWLCNPSVRKILENREHAIYGTYIEDDEVNI